jgi:hypothetical protein
MVDSSEVPQKLEVERLRGSKRGTMGLSFLARTVKSARVSILRLEVEVTPELRTAPLKDELVKAEAVVKRMEAMVSFMLTIG